MENITFGHFIGRSARSRARFQWRGFFAADPASTNPWVSRVLKAHGPINRLQHFYGSCYPREDQGGLHTGSLLDSRQHGLIVTPAEEMRIRILLQPAESPLRTRLSRKGGPDSPDRSRPGRAERMHTF